jgi:hypothetical protein
MLVEIPFINRQIFLKHSNRLRTLTDNFLIITKSTRIIKLFLHAIREAMGFLCVWRKYFSEFFLFECTSKWKLINFFLNFYVHFLIAHFCGNHHRKTIFFCQPNYKKIFFAIQKLPQDTSLKNDLRKETKKFFTSLKFISWNAFFFSLSRVAELLRGCKICVEYFSCNFLESLKKIYEFCR